MLDCRRCRNWRDEGFRQLYEENRNGQAADSYFYGCTIYGFQEHFEREECDAYQESEELFGLCGNCSIAVPKVCILLGECVNCVNTDLYCVENCHGEGERKYCSHFQRLTLEGHTIIEKNACYEVFPKPEAPAPTKDPEPAVLSIFPAENKKPRQ